MSLVLYILFEKKRSTLLILRFAERRRLAVVCRWHWAQTHSLPMSVTIQITYMKIGKTNPPDVL